MKIFFRDHLHLVKPTIVLAGEKKTFFEFIKWTTFKKIGAKSKTQDFSKKPLNFVTK